MSTRLMFFFFQAEDGIRDDLVTGVQTCALPISLPRLAEAAGAPVDGSISVRHDPFDAIEEALHDGDFHEVIVSTLPHHVSQWLHADLPQRRSEERRVGKEGRSRGCA